MWDTNKTRGLNAEVRRAPVISSSHSPIAIELNWNSINIIPRLEGVVLTNKLQGVVAPLGLVFCVSSIQLHLSVMWRGAVDFCRPQSSTLSASHSSLIYPITTSHTYLPRPRALRLRCTYLVHLELRFTLKKMEWLCSVEQSALHTTFYISTHEPRVTSPQDFPSSSASLLLLVCTQNIPPYDS